MSKREAQAVTASLPIAGWVDPVTTFVSHFDQVPFRLCGHVLFQFQRDHVSCFRGGLAAEKRFHALQLRSSDSSRRWYSVIRIITEAGLRVYKELLRMKKERVDLDKALVWIPDSKTPNGIAEVPLTQMALYAFRNQLDLAGKNEWLFPSDENQDGHQKTLKTAWHATLRRAGVRYFRIYDLRSTCATRSSAGGAADEWVVATGGTPRSSKSTHR